MRVLLLTYGSRGDVEPFLALAQGLNQAGHQTRLAAPGVFSSLADERGVSFIGLPGDPDRMVEDLVQTAGGNPLRMVKTVWRFVLPLAADVLQALGYENGTADVIVHSFLMLNAGHEIAVQDNIPDLSAQFFPVFLPTRAFPGVVAPDLPLGGGYRRFTHWLIQQVFWQGSRMMYGRLRKRHPDLAPLSGWPLDGRRPRFEGDRKPTPALYAFSPQVIPAPDDWPGWAHVTGYWAAPVREKANGRADLEAFLAAGPPPVYIGFGSVISRDPAHFTRMAVAALKSCGCRGVIATGRGGMAAEGVPPAIFLVDHIRHDWLFPRMAAAVHHGGAGTTGASLRAGIPTLIIPFTSDQPFWGRQVQRLGVGPAPIPPRKLTPDLLAAAIEGMLTDQGMKIRAQKLGTSIRQEDGVQRAIARIEAAHRSFHDND